MNSAYSKKADESSAQWLGRMRAIARKNPNTVDHQLMSIVLNSPMG